MRHSYKPPCGVKLEVTIIRMLSPAVPPHDATTPIGVSILIPVYKNEGGLEELVKRISASMATSAYAESFELILVDDCSPDNSWKVIQHLRQSIPSCRAPPYHGILGSTTPSWRV